jgi:hypothetical protein
MSASPSIFISYRVADSQPQAGRLFDALERAFGTGTAFYDKDGLKPGMKWPDELAQKVKKARVVLVLIADLSKWIGVGVEGRRIDDPDDWVRLEVEHALADTQKLVIPVLFNDGQLPTEKGLPESCRGLLKCQLINITDANWARDLAPLLARLREHLGIAEDPIKLDLKTLTGIGGGDPKVLAVPTDTGLREMATYGFVAVGHHIKIIFVDKW